MYFMDARTQFFSQYWKEAASSSLSIHRFRSHTKQEREFFERKLNKQPRNERTRMPV
jgi:hypothetical protein